MLKIEKNNDLNLPSMLLQVVPRNTLIFVRPNQDVTFHVDTTIKGENCYVLGNGSGFTCSSHLCRDGCNIEETGAS